MNQEKKTLQTAPSAGGYLAPGIRVMEIKARRVICSSTGGNTPGLTNDDTAYSF